MVVAVAAHCARDDSEVTAATTSAPLLEPPAAETAASSTPRGAASSNATVVSTTDLQPCAQRWSGSPDGGKPSPNILIVGKLSMPTSLQSRKSATQSTAPMTRCGLSAHVRFATSFQVGAKERQWPHQPAKNSTAKTVLEPAAENWVKSRNCTTFVAPS